MNKVKLFLLLLVSFSQLNLIAESTPIVINSDLKEFWIDNEYLEVLIDSTKEKNIHDIIESQSFKTIEGSTVSTNNADAYWIKFNVTDDRVYEQPFRIEMYDFDIDEVSLFYTNLKGKIKESKAGFALPFENREVNHKNVSFQLQFAKQEKATFYMRFVSKKQNLLKPVIKPYD